jgi:hypothetical protein
MPSLTNVLPIGHPQTNLVHQDALAGMRRRSHRGRGNIPCALCDGHGDVVNPGNADPAVKVTDWLPPIGCPRCGQTGKDPNP